jgi:hypothetical protein
LIQLFDFKRIILSVYADLIQHFVTSMKSYITILAVVLSIGQTFAQSITKPLTGQDAENNIQALVSENVNNVVRTHDTRYQGIKGTPFFLDKWGKASISMYDNKVYDSITLNYNVYENTLHYLDAKGIGRVLSLNNVSQFILTDSLGLNRYNFMKYDGDSGLDERSSDRYLLMLYEGGQATFAMLPQKQLLKADFKGGYSSNKPYDEFITSNIYLIAIKGQPIQKVKLTKKQLLASLADKKQEVDRFLKMENIDATKEAGWVKTLAYYHTLK